MLALLFAPVAQTTPSSSQRMLGSREAGRARKTSALTADRSEPVQGIPLPQTGVARGGRERSKLLSKPWKNIAKVALAHPLTPSRLREGGWPLSTPSPYNLATDTPVRPSIAAQPEAPNPFSIRRCSARTPPSATTGILALCANPAKAIRPNTLPPGCERVAKRGERKMRSAPTRSAACNSSAL